MTVARSLLLFVIAALAEIGGAWLVWQGVREQRGLRAGHHVRPAWMTGIFAATRDHRFGRGLDGHHGRWRLMR
ncbi:hypothetical protein ABZU75_30580 [Streptosporangium sp. NPDC005286]|uniref:hypothetical protein n=1 Tax=Streptosporangium sp. NPDC005286 TaxID=3154463 RepID=UPI0033A2E899